MKDPALLWYFNDWTGGTVTMNRHQKGAYIDLLAAQFNNGPLSLIEIKTVLGSDFGSTWPTIQKKFKSENGLYFNERLQIERDKRSSFTASRRKNASSTVLAQATDKHMEDRDINVLNINNTLEYLKSLPESELLEFTTTYNATKTQIKNKAESLYLWCGTNNKTKKNYRMFLMGRLLEDFGKRSPVIIKKLEEDTRAPLSKELSDSMRAITDKFSVKK